MNHLHNNKSEQTTDSSFTLDIEQLLKQGNVIRIKPQGTSMYPLFVPGRDEACIERTDFSSLKRGECHFVPPRQKYSCAAPYLEDHK